MDMAVLLDSGTPLSDEVAARWRDRRRAGDAVADIGENRFSMGWERRPHDSYPSCGHCWPPFAEEVSALQQAFADAGADAPVFAACELTYVNPVTFEEHGSRQSRIERLLLRWLLPDPGDGWLPRPDRVLTDATFPMTGRADGALGRLSVRMHALGTETSEPLYGMTLSAHCGVHSPSLDALGAAFDVSFEWIVRGYATLGDPPDAAI